MKQMQFRIHQYVFSPSLLGTVLTLICIPLFLKFGLWQYHKAQLKQSIQTEYNQAQVNGAREFPLEITSDKPEDIEKWKYKKVTLVGKYISGFQFLLDNQVEANRAGYHVITPVKVEGVEHYVLVNRGWIAAKDVHSELPTFTTPTSGQQIVGQVWVPSKKFFTLEAKAKQSNEEKIRDAKSWPMVWQNMDLERYKQLVSFKVSPLMIKLDAEVREGGFVRNWQVPVERITTHIGYAYQWFGFAAATLLIYLYMSISRVRLSAVRSE